MAGIKNFNTFVNKYGQDKAKQILSQEVRVTEKFDAFRFSFEKNPKTYKFQFYGKNGKVPLSRIDRTISDLYESAIDYIENLPYELKKSIPVRHRFGFSWFPSNMPLVTEYEKTPKNGLILTDITVRNNKFDVINEVKDTTVFERWSQLFKVDYAKPVFEGKLSEETINSLIGNDSLLLTESEIYTQGFLNKKLRNVEALIFEFENELIKLGKDTDIINESRSHLFDVVLLNICEHLESFPINNIKISSANPDESYIEIVSEIFNEYVVQKGQEFLESGLKRPDFLSKSGNLSKKWIKNPKTLEILENNKNYEYLYSIFLTNLKKPKYKSGLISESVANSFNEKIEEINKLAGGDFSFLEFSSILKEEKTESLENNLNDESAADYVKAVSLLTRFFSLRKNETVGKTPVNVIITNFNLLTKDVIEEADRLKKLNGHKILLIHSNSLAEKMYGSDEDNKEKIVNSLLQDNDELLIDYKIMDRPFFKKILDSLRPKYEPVIIATEQSFNDLKFEQDGLKTIYFSKENKPVQIQKINNKAIAKLQKCLTEDNLKEFKNLTPECVHPYWTQIKSSFDKFFYN